MPWRISLRDPQWCLAQAKRVGPACPGPHREGLFGNRILDRLRAAQGVLRLREGFGPKRLEAACARALTFALPSYRTVKKILKEGLDPEVS